MSLHPGTGWRISRKSRSRVLYLWYRECRIYVSPAFAIIFFCHNLGKILSQSLQDPASLGEIL